MVFFINKLISDLNVFKNIFLNFNIFILKSLNNIFFIKNNKNYNYFLESYTNYKFNFYLFELIFKKNKFIDFIWIKFYSNKYKNKFNLVNLFRSYFRILKTNNGFYFNFKKFKKKTDFLNFLKNFNFYGYFYIWNSIKLWIFPLFLLFIIVYLTLFLKSLPFNKIIFAWIAIIMFSYWLLSGFVFFF